MKAGTSSRLLPDNLTFSKLGECWTKKHLWTLPVGMTQKVSPPPRDVTVLWTFIPSPLNGAHSPVRGVRASGTMLHDLLACSQRDDRVR